MTRTSTTARNLRSRTPRRCRLVAGAAAVALIASAGAAMAQTAVGSGARPNEASAQTIDELVVTAQKRSEKLLSVPAPVSAVTGSDLQRLQAVQLADYVAQVPGLNLIADREGESQIVLRGITTGVAANSTVATYIDDTPYGSSTLYALGGLLTPDLDPGDLQRVEVLRGPQGTLYGASAMGGLVKYVTTPPDLRQFGGHVEVDGSTVNGGGDGFGLRGLVNLPLIEDKLGLRVSAYDRFDPGYISDPTRGAHDVNGARVKGGHVAVEWNPTSPLTVRLAALYQDLRSSGSSNEDIDIATGRPLYGDLEQQRFTDEYLRVRYHMYSATGIYDFGPATLTSITSYSTLQQAQATDVTSAYAPLLSPLLGIPNLGAAVGSHIGESRWSQEVRLASKPSNVLDWQVGVFFDHERSARTEPSSLFSTTTGAPIDLGQPLFFEGFQARYTEYAGFGDLTVHLTPKFDLQGGVRYSTNDQHYTQPLDGLLAGGPSVEGGTSSDDSTTFLVSASYRFAPDNMLYGRIASGYRPGGPNAITPALQAVGVPSVFKPDTLTNYEVGYKAALLDRTLTLDLSAFYINWQDIQVITVFSGYSLEGNGKSARSQGLEGAFTYRPLHGLTFSGNLAYTDAALTAPAPGVNGRRGDQLPNVPKWAGALNADYVFPLTDLVQGFVGASVRYVGDRKSGFVTGSPSDYVRPLIPHYATADLRAGVLYRGLDVEAYVKNVGDERGFADISSRSLSGYQAPWTAAVIPPRTVGISISASY